MKQKEIRRSNNKSLIKPPFLLEFRAKFTHNQALQIHCLYVAVIESNTKCRPT